MQLTLDGDITLENIEAQFCSDFLKDQFRKIIARAEAAERRCSEFDGRVEALREIKLELEAKSEAQRAVIGAEIKGNQNEYRKIAEEIMRANWAPDGPLFERTVLAIQQALIAARDAGLEEAAVICDSRVTDVLPFTAPLNACALLFTQTIRALKTGDSEGDLE